MKKKMFSNIKNIGYTIVSNIINLMVGAIITLIIPKYITQSDYGYFQLYLFYIGYVGFLHFGWADGFVLRYGGKSYDSMDKRVVGTQFKLFELSQVVISLIILIVTIFFVESRDEKILMFCILISISIQNGKTFLQYILQSSLRIKEYASNVIIEKVGYLFCSLFFLLLGLLSFWNFAIAYVIGILLALILAMIACKDLIFSPLCTLKEAIHEAKSNISVGSKLMIANLASQLIIGVIRFSIENVWNVETFGEISLVLNLANMMISFINAISIVLFPILRRQKKEDLSSIYTVVRNVLMPLLFIFIIIYYPVKIILFTWLPDYKDSLVFMSILFPICIYECKMSLMVNTFMKTLRMEKKLLFTNILTFILSSCLTLLSSVILHNLYITVFNIVLLLAFRSTFAELILAKRLSIKLNKELIIENIICLFFIFSCQINNTLIGIILYLILILVYLYIYKSKIVFSLRKIIEKV